MEGVLGATPLHRLARGPNGEWKGLLPLYRVRSRIFGDYLISLPFLNHGGPLGGAGSRFHLAEDAVRQAHGLGVDLLELRTRQDWEALPNELRRNERKVTVVLDLPSDPEELFREGLRAKVRSQIRRPLKAGMSARFGPDEVEPFIQVFRRTMRDLGTPVLPPELFRRLPRVFGDETVFGAVYRDGRPVAAGCGFHFQGEFELTWAGSLKEHRREAPNMLLYWAFMERAIRDEARRFDFGRCTPGSGSHKFKRQWGGRDVPLPWLQWSPQGMQAPPNPDSGRYNRAIQAWQRLPLGLANRLGPPLARRIP